MDGMGWVRAEVTSAFIEFLYYFFPCECREKNVRVEGRVELQDGD